VIYNCRVLVRACGVDDHGMPISGANREGELLGSEDYVLGSTSEGHVLRIDNWWLFYVGQLVPYLGFRDSRLLCSEDLDSSC
jgi:hypothetical protein